VAQKQDGTVMNPKEMFVLTLIKKKPVSFEELKKETKYDSAELMLILKKLLKQKKVLKKGPSITFYSPKKNPEQTEKLIENKCCLCR
jgi:hypothetical protein